jgi:predicted nucleic acid-binding protein
MYCELVAARTTLVPLTGSLTICRDPDDDRILETAVVGKVRYLVTRDDDIKHDPVVRRFLHARDIQVVTVSHMLRILATLPS